MGIEGAPTRTPVMGKNGMITDPWREWFQKVEDALNKTETVTVVTQAVPEETTEITYVDGA